VASAQARPAVTKDVTRMRQRPNTGASLLTELPAGTRVEVVGERDGWLHVETRDGRTGYIWSEQLVQGQAEASPRTTEHVPEPDPSERSLLDEVRALRSEVGALRERPEPASAADLERVHTELQQLAQSSRDLSQRLAGRLGAISSDPPPDTVSTVSLLFLGVGVTLGLLGGRLAQRRDRRQRPRLKV
jgi:uncharacterized protein YgiM (DUF1202 family)